MLFFLLFVAVPQEDGVVHGDGQLQHGGQRLGDVGYLTEEVVAAQIKQDAHADAGKEHKGHQPAVQQDHHGGAGAGLCAGTEDLGIKLPSCGMLEGQPKEVCSMKLSARNQLPGKVTDIQDGAVNAIVKIDIGGGNVVSATISREAVRKLGLKVGEKAYAVVKATSVMVAIDDSPATRA